MNVVLILLAVSLTIAGGFLVAFIWSVKNGQFEDDYTPSVRILFDDQIVPVKDQAQAGTVNFVNGYDTTQVRQQFENPGHDSLFSQKGSAITQNKPKNNHAK